MSNSPLRMSFEHFKHYMYMYVYCVYMYKYSLVYLFIISSLFLIRLCRCINFNTSEPKYVNKITESNDSNQEQNMIDGKNVVREWEHIKVITSAKIME